MMVEVDDHKVVVDYMDWVVVVVVEHYYDDLDVAVNRMMNDSIEMMVMVDDHRNEKEVVVYDQHLNEINSQIFVILRKIKLFYCVEEVEVVVVVMIDFVVVVEVVVIQVVVVVIVEDIENVDYNYCYY